MAGRPHIRKPILFTFVTLASAVAAIGACVSLAGLAAAPGPQQAHAAAKPHKVATSQR